MKDPKQFVKAHKDRIPGGKADKKQPKDFDPKQLAAGTKVEREHTKDSKLAREIAMDHLVEDPMYYEKLRQVHTEKSQLSTENPKLSRISHAIERHNRKKLHSLKRVSKSYDFQNAKVSVEAQDQLLAQSAPKELIDYLKRSIGDDISKIPFDNGVLTVTKRDEGLYNAFFSDDQGQIIEKFDDLTVEMIAKNMEIKGLYLEKNYHDQNPEDEEEDRDIAKEEALKISAAIMAHHNKTMHSGGVPSGSKFIRIKVGDVELEMRKSVSQFVSDFRTKRTVTKDDVKKSIQAWRRNTKSGNFQSDLEAAEFLLKNWDTASEEYCQALFAMKDLKGKK